MKGLIIKDIYNIGHNMKSMLITLIILAIAFIPQKDMGPVSYVIASSVICCTMVNTTFYFDDTSDWTKYAMILPITKKELVLSKYIVLLIFTVLGSLLGFSIGMIGGIITKQVALINLNDILAMLVAIPAGIAVGLIIGSIAIALIFKYGSEQARILMVASVAIPGILVYTIYKIGLLFDINLSATMLKSLMLMSPLIIIAFIYLMFKISCKLFIKKDL